MQHPQSLKQKLNEEYKYRIELHAHTSPVSRCSDILPEDMAKIYSENGYHGVVITNHFADMYMDNKPKEQAVKRYLEDYRATQKAAEKYGLKIYLGAEIRFSENMNDYLLYGVDENILKMCFDYLKTDVKTFRKKLCLPDSVFVQAHPFRDGMLLCDPQLLDGIETFNMHPGHNSRVALAEKYALENNFKIITAGTDFHHIGHQAAAALRTKTLPDDSFGIAEILKSRDYLLEIGKNSLVLP